MNKIMGNCLTRFRMRSYEPLYKPRNWDTADIEMEKIVQKYEMGDYEKLEDRVGPNGFPYKIRGNFAKVVMKSRHNNGFKLLMNINRLRKLKNQKGDFNFFLLPTRIEETEYSHIFFFPLLDHDMVDWVQSYLWSPSLRDNIFNKLCAAINFLHENGFVHRDIKLENICMRRNEPILIDLDNCSLASVALLKGTKDYMPHALTCVHLFEKRLDIEDSIKTKWLDCYALAKTFAMILCIENERKKPTKLKFISIIWLQWCKGRKSMRNISLNREDLLVVSQWWGLIYDFAYYNEEAVYDKTMQIKDIKIYKHINF